MLTEKKLCTAAGAVIMIPTVCYNKYERHICIIALTGLSFSPQREKIREKFVAALKEEFAGKGLRFTKGIY